MLPPENASPPTAFRWLATGAEGLEAMADAIGRARESILLEMYIFQNDSIGERFREALIMARRRGVRVRVLLDALGSIRLPTSFWTPLVTLGGEFRWFNTFRASERYGCRDHRKILVIDRRLAFIGGFNVADEYDGDGVRSGWRDLGLAITGPAVEALTETFEEFFAKAADRPPAFAALRKQFETERHGENWTLLLTGPGRGHRALRRALMRDLSRAREVRIECAYFTPTWRLRRALMRVARRGGRVQLILAGKSDVPLSRLAAQSLYSRLMRAGVEIYEYEPQILHSKLFLIDDTAAYAGSANLDARSLKINYELLLRLSDPAAVREGHALFAAGLSHSRRLDPALWRASRNGLRRLLERLAWFLLARLDPYLTNPRWRSRAAGALEKLE